MYTCLSVLLATFNYRLIIRQMERQVRGKWNFLHHPRLTSGEKDEIYYNAIDWNLNGMRNNKLDYSSKLW